MDHDLLGSVAGVTDQLRQSQALLRQVRARTRDSREGADESGTVGEGADESGTVTIIIGDDGTARDVRVATDWRRRLVPAHVGAAVLAADTAAANRRDAAAVEALACGMSTHDGPAPSGEAPSLQEPVRRSVGELSAALVAAFDDLDRLAEPEPEVHGIGAGGAVRVSMAQGRITGCTVNEGWLAHQDDITLADGLREAVSSAAAAALAVRTPFVEYPQRLLTLVAQAQAFIAEVPAGGSR